MNYSSPRRKKTGYEKIVEEIIVASYPNMGKEIAAKSRKPKESHAG